LHDCDFEIERLKKRYKSRVRRNQMKEAIEDKRQGCPVCGVELGSQVPDAEYVLEELFYTGERIRIVTQYIVVEVDFDHGHDEDGFTLDEPHALTAVIKIGFDRSGKAISSDVLQIKGVDNG
jgi:hypothetical protein